MCSELFINIFSQHLTKQQTTLVHAESRPVLRTAAGLQNILSLSLRLNLLVFTQSLSTITGVGRKLPECWQTFRIIFFYRLNLSCVRSFWFVIVLCPCFPCSTFENNFSSCLFDTLWVFNSAALCNQFSLRLAVKYANSVCLWSPLSVIKYIFSCFTEWIVA